jgi:cytochrome c-type biogenesis protein CcmH/NrfG
MRCLECVSACPRRALAYRFGRPALQVARGEPPRYVLSGTEECGLLTLFGLSFVALHGVYDAVPLLVSLAASAIVAFLGVVATRLIHQPVVALRGTVLTYDRRFSRAGRLFVAGVTAAFLIVGHCLLIQYHQWRASVSLEALEFPRLRAAYTAADEQLARRAQDHLRFCSRYGLIDSLGAQMQQAWLSRLLAEPLEVEAHLRRAVVLDPAQPAGHFNLGKELARQGRRGEAAAAFDEAIRLAPQLARFVPRSRGDAPAQ